MQDSQTQPWKQYFVPIITGAVGGYIANELPGYIKSLHMSPKTELMIYIITGIAIAYLITWLYQIYKKQRREDREYIRTQIRQLDDKMKLDRNNANRQLTDIRTEINERIPQQ